MCVRDCASITVRYRTAASPSRRALNFPSVLTTQSVTQVKPRYNVSLGTENSQRYLEINFISRLIHMGAYGKIFSRLQRGEMLYRGTLYRGFTPSPCFKCSTPLQFLRVLNP